MREERGVRGGGLHRPSPSTTAGGLPPPPPPRQRRLCLLLPGRRLFPGLPRGRELAKRLCKGRLGKELDPDSPLWSTGGIACPFKQLAHSRKVTS